MRILALEPFYGGSHRAYLDGLARHSAHDFTLLTLPACHWKWRMRQASIAFAEQTNLRLRSGEMWNLILCTDMLNLAEFLGLAEARLHSLPTVAYFHENQLTYPVQREDERDLHFAVSNLVTCLAADAVWFNSEYHRREWLDALPAFLSRMPDRLPGNLVGCIRDKSQVHYPGIESISFRAKRRPGPIRILWCARCEHDKGPEVFFEAVRILKQCGATFRLMVVGEQFAESPAVFDWAREHFRDEIDTWGCRESRQDYLEVLRGADVVVSTANHEFLGISVVEAIAAGCYPLLPRRLSYPEILRLDAEPESERFFYDGSAGMLERRLAELARTIESGSDLAAEAAAARCCAVEFEWAKIARQLDRSLEAVAAGRSAGKGC